MLAILCDNQYGEVEYVKEASCTDKTAIKYVSCVHLSVFCAHLATI
jgi:hypothetical protein